jgi:hypothetical protein
MESLIHGKDEDSASNLTWQAVWFSVHTVLALGSWFALMLVGYALNPLAISQSLILIFSILVPLLFGYIVNSFRQDDMAPLVWLVGLIWIVIVCMWILDMPTAPNACLQCDATEKLSRTFLSWPMPSGLIDDDGPFIGTWPAAALLGYAIGARFSLRRRSR